MVEPPRLDPSAQAGPLTRRHALLINPFYPKDPHASFGKHVLTPSLALTSVAGATPAHWTVEYWDENLLRGAPPLDPFVMRTSTWSSSASAAASITPETETTAFQGECFSLFFFLFFEAFLFF